MKISTKGRYALRTMLDLAMHDEGTLIPLKDISSRQGITVKYLEQVMNLLSKAGYVRSVRGPGAVIVWPECLRIIRLGIYFGQRKAVWHQSPVLRMKRINVQEQRNV